MLSFRPETCSRCYKISKCGSSCLAANSFRNRLGFSSQNVSGSGLVKTFKSRCGIFKQGSRRLGESRILPSATLFCIPCSSTGGNISSEVVCKPTYMYGPVNIYTAKCFTDRGWTNYLSPRDCADLLFAIEKCRLIVSNISQTHGGW